MAARAQADVMRFNVPAAGSWIKQGAGRGSLAAQDDRHGGQLLAGDWAGELNHAGLPAPGCRLATRLLTVRAATLNHGSQPRIAPNPSLRRPD